MKIDWQLVSAFFLFLGPTLNMVWHFKLKNKEKRFMKFHKKYLSHLRNCVDYQNQIRDFVEVLDYKGIDICQEQIDIEIKVLNSMINEQP